MSSSRFPCKKDSNENNRGSWRSRHGESRSSRQSFNSSRGRQNHQRIREVDVKVPKDACGLIVGKKGRNIKELQRTEGIRFIKVDFKSTTVKVVGTEDGILAAQRRIDQAICIAVNSASYFPEKTLTCFRSKEGSDGIVFKPFGTLERQLNSYAGVRLEQLDVHRDYSIIHTSAGDGNLNNEDGASETNKEFIIVGYSESLFMPFLESVVRNNIEAMTEPATCVEFSVNFGKTFLSSVPEEVVGQVLSPKDVNALKYGKDGIRPEFVRHFHLGCRESFLNSILDEYVPMESGKWAVIHCISQLSKKRYAIKLKYSDKDDEADVSMRTMEQIADAKTYFEVLGIADAGVLSAAKVDIAYQRRKLAVHPDNNSHPQAGEALALLNEARKCLRDVEAQKEYRALPSPRQAPRNRFVFSKTAAGTGGTSLPDVQGFRSKVRKLGLLTVLDDGPKSEFRTTIEIERDEASMDQNMRQKLQAAWDKKSDDKFRFPGGTDDWLIVESERYKERETYSNGSFTLTVDRTEEKHFGKTMDGINISLKSVDVNDSIAWLASVDEPSEKEHLMDGLLESLGVLQKEAVRISSLLDDAIKEI